MDLPTVLDDILLEKMKEYKNLKKQNYQELGEELQKPITRKLY